MEFPHLKDTRFPNIDTVDVYAFANTFDYTRWNEKTKIRLVNVLWDSIGDNAPWWDSDADRDAWFDAIEDGFELTLEQAARIVPDGTIKLPLPYDVMARYNYIYIEMPIATSNNQMIDYENTSGIRRWHFFVGNQYYASPNTTTVLLRPDIWVDFMHDISIKYMMLERGHAPIAATSVANYLSNPIANNQYLLTPDVDFGGTTVVRDSSFVPVGNGTKWLCLASMCNPSQIDSLGTATYDSSAIWGNPTYSDENSREGYQAIVNGITFGNGWDYSNMNTLVGNGTNDHIANNVSTYAIQYSASFLEDLRTKCPAFLQTIVASFIVDDAMLSIGSSHTIAGYTVYECSGSSYHLSDFELSESMFGFDSDYSSFAKLYTYPYSVLELTDNDGHRIDLRIEDTVGNLPINLITSVAFPFLNMRVLVGGIGGDGSAHYSWKRLNGNTVSKSIDNSDWYEHSFDWDIPTYGLFMDGQTAQNMRNYHNRQQALRDALVGYHTSVREANTAMQNAIDAANTAEDNVNANATTMIANNANSCNTNTANTAAATACATANTTASNDYGMQICAAGNDQMREDVAATNWLAISTTDVENETSIATTDNSNSAIVSNGIVNGALSGGQMGSAAGGYGALGGAMVGAVVGGFTANTTASANKANAMALVQCKQTVTNQMVNSNNAKLANGTSANTEIQTWLGADKSTQTKNQNECLTTQTQNNNTCATNNTTNTTNTMNANAARTRGTSNANSGYTRGVAVRNAKEILENAQDRAKATLNDAANQPPLQMGSFGGSMAPDYIENRGIQIKIRTESDSAIRSAASHFARYGYALDQIWDLSETGLVPMKHFCYWKANDIWVDDTHGSNSAAGDFISKMFLRGVTIWKNPDEIGKVDIYDN